MVTTGPHAARRHRLGACDNAVGLLYVTCKTTAMSILIAPEEMSSFCSPHKDTQI